MELRNAESKIDEVVATYKLIREGDTEWQRGLAPLSFLDTNTEPKAIPEALSATRALNLLETIKTKLLEMRPVMDKFLKRLNDKDPVSDKPRYGAQTAIRVRKLLDRYIELVSIILHETFGHNNHDVNNTTTAASAIPNNSTVLEVIKSLATQEEAEQKRKEDDEMTRQQQEENERRSNEARILEEQHRLVQEQQRQIEIQREELAQQARAIRDATIRAQREEARRDREWVASIPNKKSIIGVQMQLDVLLAGTTTNLLEQRKAIQALYTIFEQIVSHPEEVNFRRIRRDHPAFLDDIGRHPGGKEFLLAAGFDLGVVDEVPSFICREPNIETDMDGWSTWFDLLKETVKLLNEQQKKK